MPKNLPFKDIVIIGSGASGGACKLGDFQVVGASVLVLEQGPWSFDKNDYPGDSNHGKSKQKIPDLTLI